MAVLDNLMDARRWRYEASDTQCHWNVSTAFNEFEETKFGKLMLML